MQFFAVLLLTITLAVSTIATPFHVAERRDIAPPNIIVPQTRDKWILGFAALLCWDVDPQQDSDATGSAYLGNWLTEFDILSDPQIASSFPLSIGCTNVDLDGVFPGFYTLFLAVDGADTGSSSVGPLVVFAQPPNGTTTS